MPDEVAYEKKVKIKTLKTPGAPNEYYTHTLLINIFQATKFEEPKTT